MENLRRRLPPLDPLIAFEAAARLESFTRAAEELNLSQAAVSQQIRRLEADLGAALFIRARRRVWLTAQGRAFQHTASGALRQIAAAAEDLRSAPDAPQITVAVDHSIASLWLAPRLSAFRAAAAGADVRIIATDDEDAAFADDVDFSIVHGAGNWPGRDATPLFAERVFPVAAPAYLAACPPLSDPGDVPAHRLIGLEDDRWDWLDWRTWLSRAGVDAPVRRPALRLSTYPLVIEAAAAGEGLALGWAGLVDQAIADGRLVRPALPEVATAFGYHLVRPAARAWRPEAATLADWVANAFRHGR